jgi:hypothetical protein
MGRRKGGGKGGGFRDVQQRLARIERALGKIVVSQERLTAMQERLAVMMMQQLGQREDMGWLGWLGIAQRHRNESMGLYLFRTALGIIDGLMTLVVYWVLWLLRIEPTSITKLILSVGISYMIIFPFLWGMICARFASMALWWHVQKQEVFQSISNYTAESRDAVANLTASVALALREYFFLLLDMLTRWAQKFLRDNTPLMLLSAEQREIDETARAVEAILSDHLPDVSLK